MVQRGYPGIHAGMPTPQYLRSASVVNGAPRSKAEARRPDSRPGSPGRTPVPLWERACSRCGGSVCGDVGYPQGFWERHSPVARGFIPAGLRSSP